MADAGIRGRVCGYQPTDDDVRTLIGRAEQHPLGTDFIVKGVPDAVAATFQVHAFVVDAARETLKEGVPVIDVVGVRSAR